jgi:putative colanic acid biosynthesis UDP-glucose lipid carrier transferase
MPILSLKREPLEDFGNSFRKRSFDFTVSLFAVVFILSWLIPLLGILIFLESPGPIFFKQVRTGRNNKNFNCLKFRSMKMNKDSDVNQATRNDKRVTFIGSIIRKTSLDEFPQFINVLKGDMSIVGPRPHMVKHTSDYSKLVEGYMSRHFLKPGITGWAQIHGYRGEIKEAQQIIKRVEADIWYSENWSFWLDVKIVFLTILHLITSNKNVY